jgi:hypothetical protein
MDKKKALIAVAHSILVIIYHMLKEKVYREPVLESANALRPGDTLSEV